MTSRAAPKPAAAPARPAPVPAAAPTNAVGPTAAPASQPSMVKSFYIEKLS